MNVRAIDNDYTLIYAYDRTASKGAFILYEHSTGVTKYFYTPQYAQVMDMEIKNENVYFCGNTIAYTAFVGQFDIFGCFAGTSPLKYGLTPITTSPYEVVMNTATRMTVMESNGDIHILAIGDATHNYTEPTPYVASTLFSAVLQGASWNFHVDYQKAHQYYYTDIDCSDNYVVYTGTDVNDYAYFFVCGHIPNFFSSPSYPWSFALNTQVEGHQLLLKAMNGDRFAIASLPLAGNWVELVNLPVPVPATLTRYSTLASTSTPYAPGFWNLHEIRHNDVFDHPILLGKMALPPNDVFGTWVTEFDWTGTTYSHSNSRGINFSSLDGVGSTTNYVATDNLISNLSLGKEDLFVYISQCFYCQSVSTTQATFVYGTDNINHDPCQNTSPNVNLFPEIKKLDPQNICE